LRVVDHPLFTVRVPRALCESGPVGRHGHRGSSNDSVLRNLQPEVRAANGVDVASEHFTLGRHVGRDVSKLNVKVTRACIAINGLHDQFVVRVASQSEGIVFLEEDGLHGKRNASEWVAGYVVQQHVLRNDVLYTIIVITLVIVVASVGRTSAEKVDRHSLVKSHSDVWIASVDNEQIATYERDVIGTIPNHVVRNQGTKRRSLASIYSAVVDAVVKVLNEGFLRRGAAVGSRNGDYNGQDYDEEFEHCLGAVGD